MKTNISLLLKCRHSKMVKSLSASKTEIIAALCRTTSFKNAVALIDNLEPEDYIRFLGSSKSLKIAKYIIKKYTEQGGVVDYNDAMLDVPYYTHLSVHLDLNAYFIKAGGDFTVFTLEYLRELYEFDPELRIIFADYLNEKISQN